MTWWIVFALAAVAAFAGSYLIDRRRRGRRMR